LGISLHLMMSDRIWAKADAFKVRATSDLAREDGMDSPKLARPFFRWPGAAPELADQIPRIK
jgi:hypothetical protein